MIKDTEDTCTLDPTKIYGAVLHSRLGESGRALSKHVTCSPVAGPSRKTFRGYGQEVEKKSGKPSNNSFFGRLGLVYVWISLIHTGAATKGGIYPLLQLVGGLRIACLSVAFLPHGLAGGSGHRGEYVCTT